MRKALGSNHKEGVYEMYRFCVKINTVVIGIATKLFSFFVKIYNPTEIISFCDYRYGTGKLYEILKFNSEGKTKPNYWYTMCDGKRYHRFNFRKNVLHKKLKKFNNSLSEWQNMQNNGWDRIWDCGNLRYKWQCQ